MNASDMSHPAIVVDQLHLAYGERQVLNGLHWQVPRGQVVGLLGRNGAGKTSLLETLLGLRDQATGRVQLLGEPVPEISDALRCRIGYVPQQSNLFEWMTPAQLLSYFRSFYPRWNEARVQSLLQRWAVDANQPIAQLSGGQQQRLSIIRALAHEPELLILDEPVAGLDPAGRRDFLQEVVTEVMDRGTTVVFSTHILSDLERVAFHVAFMAAGRIVLQAPLDELKEGARLITGPDVAVRQQVRAQGWQVMNDTAQANGQTRLLVRRAERAADSGEGGPAAGTSPGTSPSTSPCTSPPPSSDAWPDTWPGTETAPVTLEDLFMGLTQ